MNEQKSLRSWLAEPGAPVVLLSLGSIAAAGALYWSDSGAYRFILGGLHPVATTLVTSVVGLLSLWTLERRGWFYVGGGGRQGYRAAVALGILLTIPVIVVDGFGGFPSDINVRAPQSLLFYPAIAVVAEFIFHAVPLALVALLAGLTSVAQERARQFGMFVAAAIEPALQVSWDAAHSPAWANTYVGVHLLVFNSIGMLLFRRHGFVTMYMYRVAYYMIWHIAWGHARLALLFGGAG